MGVFWQVISTLAISITCINMGMINTWPSITITLFESANTTLNRPMMVSETSLFGGLSSIGALVSTPLMGCSIDLIGRKKCMIIIALFQLTGWIIASTTRQVEWILTTMFISGLSGAVYFVAPMYLAEFCQENIRGTMTVVTMTSYSVGNLITYVLNHYLSYERTGYAILACSVVGLLVLGVLKESPVLLMKKGLEEDAAKAIAFYRGTHYKSKLVADEMNKIRRSLNPEIDRDRDPETKKLKTSVTEVKAKVNIIQFMNTSKSTRHAFFIGFSLISLCMLQGFSVVQVYADPLFRTIVPSLPVNLCCIMLAIVTLVSGFPPVFLADRAGRRNLMIWASIGTCSCCLALSIQIHWQLAPQMFTVVLIYIFCVMYYLGPASMPYVFCAEVFLPEVRSKLNAFLLEMAWICNFIAVYSFYTLSDLIGLGPIFFIYSIISFTTALISYVYQPETKGLTVDAIQELFTNKEKKIKLEIL